MSEAVTATLGATFDGAVSVRDAGLMGMITVRGDLGSAALSAAVKSVTGLVPPAQRQIKIGKKGSVAWMSPDELMLFVDYDKADDLVAKLSDELAGEHHLAVNVSDARACFILEGEGVREVIAKGSPANLASDSLPVGEIRRSRIGQIAAAFWLSGETTLTVVCFRSVGQHMFKWLSVAAEKDTLPGIL